MANSILFHDYLSQNLSSTVMIVLTISDQESVQYNYWNWFHQISQLHLLKDDMSIGHIIHTGTIEYKDDGSIIHTSKYHPTHCSMSFYFGGVSK